MNTIQKSSIFIIVLLSFLIFSYSCSKDDGVDLLPSVYTSINQTNYKFVKISGAIDEVDGLDILNKGVCWAKTSSPSVQDSKIAFGKGLKNFTATISGLEPDSTYYVRAFATSKKGTKYGNVVTFKAPRMITFKPSSGTVKFTYDSIYDIDNNKYYVDTIGTQIWMCENLRVTKFRDGSSIEKIASASSWVVADSVSPTNIQIAAYCYYNNSAEDVLQNGLLYNWYAVNDARNIAPEGWRVATAQDWATLAIFLKGEAIAGALLKEPGNYNWNYYSSSANGTNTKGFTALPGGFRSDYNGGFYYFGRNAYFWTATQADVKTALVRSLGYSEVSLGKVMAKKTMGCSVRCVKDLVNN